LLAASCGGGASNTEASDASSSTGTETLNAIVGHKNWVSSIQEDPSELIALINEHRPALIALHKGDLSGATNTPNAGTIGRRAQFELSRLHLRLAEVNRYSWLQIVTEYKTRTGKEAPAMLRGYAQLADYKSVSHNDFPEEIHTTLDIVESAFNDDGAGASVPLVIMLSQRTWETFENKVRLYNPLTHQYLASLYAQTPSSGLSDLPALLFSNCATDAVRPRWSGPYRGVPESSLYCTSDGLLAAAGLNLAAPQRALGEEDEPQKAREFVRTLDDAVTAWSVELSKGPNPEGVALVNELQLTAIYRTQSLLALAEALLDAERPRQAAAVAMLAQDLQAPKQINHINSPILFAILAEAKIRTGHARAALDYLEVLVSAFPEVKGLDETVGDLVVLQNLNRQGDSKEL